jgi:predicted ABC-type ATPase
MFAGPNGSGKSTLKAVLRPDLLGVYVNPDDIERELRGAGGRLDLRPYGVKADEAAFRQFVANSSLLASVGLLEEASELLGRGDALDFSGVTVTSYHASIAADFIRRALLAKRASFTFETVMSSTDKIDVLCRAQAQGYRTYLYFVATDDPAINVDRVRRRVAGGGHAVPEDKIRSRYDRSLANLRAAVKCTDRAYIFDNSGQALVWMAEVTGGRDVALKHSKVPAWFEAALPVS